MKLSTFAVVGHLLILVQSAALPSAGSNPVVHEKRHTPATRWIKRDRIAPQAILPVRIGLTQNNLEKGHDFLMDV